jgi:aspartate racemase
MIKHIGIVGCSAEGAALCYRTICTEAEASLGEHCHPEVSMHTFSLADYMKCLATDDWQGVGELMAESANNLAEIGADFAICPDNTIHQAFEFATEGSSIPWLHIAEAVADQAREHGYNTVGITGTNSLMTGPVYPTALERFDIEHEIPGEADRREIDRTIFKKLVKGVFSDESKALFNGVFDELGERGCDAVVMGCTEIPILMDGVETSVPTLDSTRILARAALSFSIQEDD